MKLIRIHSVPIDIASLRFELAVTRSRLERAMGKVDDLEARMLLDSVKGWFDEFLNDLEEYNDKRVS